MEKYNIKINKKLDFLTDLVQQGTISNNAVVLENGNIDVALPCNTINELHQINAKLTEENEYNKYVSIV